MANFNNKKIQSYLANHNVDKRVYIQLTHCLVCLCKWILLPGLV